jgi:hypothetical protein
MGCIQKGKPIMSLSKVKRNIRKITINNSPLLIIKSKFIQKLTPQNWLKIIQFISYKDLKELGKVNRMFNHYVKQKEILVKFFRRVHSEYTEESSKQIQNIKKYSEIPNQNIHNLNLLSFSILQKEPTISIDKDDSFIRNNYSNLIK